MKHYKLRYEVEFGEFAKEDANGKGLTDALVVASIIYGDDGSVSTAFVSRDGRTHQPLKPWELFRTMTLLAHGLRDEESLHPWQREICNDVFERTRAVVTRKR